MVADVALAAYWDRHDWHGLFWRERAAWLDGRIRVVVFGHATLEHALTPRQLSTAKCVLVQVPAGDEQGAALALLAARIRAGECLDDPQALRPLPLSGIPGWHDDNRHEDFYRSAECFRPLRPGRVYPAPMRV